MISLYKHDQYKGSINFHILSNTENQGPSVSRNNGLLNAKGDYVFFLDSDDYLSKNCLSCLYKEINQHGCIVDMVIGNSYDYQSGHYWQNKEGTPSLIISHVDIMRWFLRVEISGEQSSTRIHSISKSSHSCAITDSRHR